MEEPSYLTNFALNPEDFLDALGLNETELEFCKRCSIFTIRQLAFSRHLNCNSIIESDEANERLIEFIHKAQEIVANYHPTHNTHDTHNENTSGTVWGYSYISPSVYDQIEKDSAFKSPYVLFQDYMASSPENRDMHPWKNVYFSQLNSVSQWTESAGRSFSDIDVFSYLVWKGSQSVLGSFDLSAGARAIPFLYGWLPGELHGSALAIDQITSKEINNPFIAERYAHPIAINLTKLCGIHHAKLYKAETFKANKLDNLLWRPTTLKDVTNPIIWHAYFNPGENLTETVPHACVVTPNGEIPLDCLRLYAKKVPTERTVHIY
jgi:hypothetical protein